MSTEGIPEAEQSSFYEAIGRALTSWSGVEIHLSMLFSVLATGNRTDNAALAAFLAVDTFRPRLEMILSLLKVRTNNKAIFETWATTVTKIQKRQRKRSQLAHWGVLTERKAKRGRRMALIPSFMDPISRADFHSHKLNGMFEKDIYAAMGEFNEVRNLLKSFTLDLEQFLGISPGLNPLRIALLRCLPPPIWSGVPVNMHLSRQLGIKK